MSTVRVLVEIKKKQPDAFELHRAALESTAESTKQAESLASKLAGLGLEVQSEYAPVPMFAKKTKKDREVWRESFSRGATAEAATSRELSAESTVISCEVERSKLRELKEQSGIKVWPNSTLVLHSRCPDCGAGPANTGRHPLDLARSGGSGPDCPPYAPAVEIAHVRELLGTERIFQDGFRGQNMVVGVLDEGVNGAEYPVVGGFSRPDAPPPGSASINSHGSMCAADVLVAAPAAKIYDYPFLGIPDSGGALAMMQAVLDQRQIDGTPHLTTNSYGFMGRPSQTLLPDHEVWDIDHPYNRKVVEVVTSGCPCFFSAGNCGEQCPDGRCLNSGIGPGKSIHAANSLDEVITIAAVNHQHQRIGYSSQGPGGFEPRKPDVSGYSHFFGNFGPGRPAGGTTDHYDSGTSAACPLVAGVGALLMSAFPTLLPADLKQVLIGGATDLGVPGWDAQTGFGVVNAAVSYTLLRNAPVPVA
jgi:hypothetical protein